MDPIQAIAARQVSPARKSAAAEIDAFYDAHALEGWHDTRRAFRHIVALFRDARGWIGRKASTATGIASAEGRA